MYNILLTLPKNFCDYILCGISREKMSNLTVALHDLYFHHYRKSVIDKHNSLSLTNKVNSKPNLCNTPKNNLSVIK